jgi:hypothetical protein
MWPLEVILSDYVSTRDYTGPRGLNLSHKSDTLPEFLPSAGNYSLSLAQEFPEVYRSPF